MPYCFKISLDIMSVRVLMSIKVNNIKYLNTLTKIKYPDDEVKCPD